MARKKKLTRRQFEVLSFVVSQILARGYPPTLAEIGKAMKIASTNGVRDHILVLERKGYLERRASRARGILPIWDAVEGVGLPRPAQLVTSSSSSSGSSRGSGRSSEPSAVSAAGREIIRVPILGTAS